MYLYEAASQSFVLLQADWHIEKARQLLQGIDCTHVIIRRSEPANGYYLFTKHEVEGFLVPGQPAQTTLVKAFNLDAIDPTPALDAYTDATAVTNRSVVLADGRLDGFVDFSRRPTRGLARPAAEEPEESIDSAWAPVLPRFPDVIIPEEVGAGPAPVPRSLVADIPQQVTLNQEFSLYISLSQQPGNRPAVQLAVPVGTKIDIVVQPQHGLELVGEGELSLTVTNEAEPLPLQFKLKATEVGPAKVRVLAFDKGQPLAGLTLAPVVVPEAAAHEGALTRHEAEVGPITVHQPDLTLLILESQSNGLPTFSIRLTAANSELGYNLKLFGPVDLRVNPLEYFNDFFKDIEDLPLDTPEQRADAQARLAAKGAHLFEALVPEDLRVILWSLKDQIKTVEVESTEPWIPWEICKLEGTSDGRIEEGRFFCEQFAITRWIPGLATHPRLTLKNLAVVMPADSGLPFAAPERDYLLSLKNGDRQVRQVPATFQSVRNGLIQGVYDGWHFSGHGGFRAPDPDRSVMLLEGKSEFHPDELSGCVRNLGLAHPLVFLNACQIGRGGMSLTGIGGWANRFLEAGAAAFIGAYWSVYDQAAMNFAQSFYGHLLAGEPIGEAVRQSRAAIRSLEDPTWLAYTVFADPLARLEV